MMIIAQPLRGRNLKDEKGNAGQSKHPKEECGSQTCEADEKIELGGNSNMTRSPKTIDAKK